MDIPGFFKVCIDTGDDNGPEMFLTGGNDRAGECIWVASITGKFK